MYISPTDQYGDDVSVMVWGGISGRYRTDLVVIQGNLKEVCYSNQILAPHMQPFRTAHVKIMLKCFNKTMISPTQPESVLHSCRLHGFKLRTGLPSPLILAPMKLMGNPRGWDKSNAK